jgi:hypothetical protein
MMSLSKVKMWDVVKKQYQYKVRSYSQVLVSLMMMQLLSMVFSLNSTSSSSTSSDTLNFELKYYSADLVVAFTILWGFITAIITTTKRYRNDDFIFITNRLSSNSSNLLLLVTASLVGGFTAMLSNFLLKVILSIFNNGIFIQGMAGISFTHMLLGVLTTSLYIFLFTGLGYLVGTLVQISRIIVVLLPGLLFGSAFLSEANGESGLIEKIFSFFFTESSLSLFIVKAIAVGLLCFACAFALSNRMEVKE